MFIEPYVCFNSFVIQLRVLVQRSDSFMSPKRREPLFEARPTALRCNGVHATAKDRSLKVDEVIWFLCYSVIEKVIGLTLANPLYGQRDE